MRPWEFSPVCGFDGKGDPDFLEGYGFLTCTPSWETRDE